MSTIKRGRGIKGRNSSHCKLLKYAKGDEYDLLGWDQNNPGNAQTENRSTSDVYPDNATNDPPPSLPETEVLGDQHQTAWWPRAAWTQKARASSNFHVEHFVQGDFAELDKREEK